MLRLNMLIYRSFSERKMFKYGKMSGCSYTASHSLGVCESDIITSSLENIPGWTQEPAQCCRAVV